MLETFQTALQFCGMISVSLAVPWSIDRITGRHHRRLARKAAYDVLIAHLVDHRDEWIETKGSHYDYTLSHGKLTVSFNFTYTGRDMNWCQINGEEIKNSVGWKLHRAYTGGDTDLSHVIVRSIKPPTPLMLASAVS